MGHRTFSEAVGSSTYYPHAAISCLVSLILYKFVSPRVSRKIWKNYDLSPESVRVNWDTRFVSMVHSLVVSLMSSYAQLFDDDMHANLIWWDCAVARAACAIVVGYLSFDFILITVHYKHMGEVGFYFHHSASIYAYYFAVTYAMMPFFANFRLLAELSTPFLNVRWFLLTMGVSKSSPAFIINGLLFLVSFFLCRIVAIPFYWYKSTWPLTWTSSPT
ncbi:TLC domain-containing protein 4-B-like [Babylonia areolata]|uniref:TLC domain-containing protein 4-B-like n=1 Tax=Babylonia areolata TaxID=304850 RepID=UPI003FD3EA74